MHINRKFVFTSLIKIEDELTPMLSKPSPDRKQIAGKTIDRVVENLPSHHRITSSSSPYYCLPYKIHLQVL